MGTAPEVTPDAPIAPAEPNASNEDADTLNAIAIALAALIVALVEGIRAIEGPDEPTAGGEAGPRVDRRDEMLRLTCVELLDAGEKRSTGEEARLGSLESREGCGSAPPKNKKSALERSEARSTRSRSCARAPRAGSA